MFCGLVFFPIAKISELMVDNLAKLKQNRKISFKVLLGYG
ncbi:uncharacterized protein METZ01_LOCUS78266 [marine metagenome]|uniref:Uncharacterized protein n=1 Tax=marine metagenome TaxID=408172 RepID=A0A381UB14_9ZZZZ